MGPLENLIKKIIDEKDILPQDLVFDSKQSDFNEMLKEFLKSFSEIEISVSFWSKNITLKNIRDFIKRIKKAISLSLDIFDIVKLEKKFVEKMLELEISLIESLKGPYQQANGFLSVKGAIPFCEYKEDVEKNQISDAEGIEEIQIVGLAISLKKNKLLNLGRELQVSEGHYTCKDTLGRTWDFEITLEDEYSHISYQIKKVILNPFGNKYIFNQENLWLNCVQMGTKFSEQRLGWKFHVTVNYADIEKAFDILLKHKLASFKVVSEQDQAKLARDIVQEAKSMTIYVSIDPAKNIKTWVSVMHEIVDDFATSNIRSGSLVKTDQVIAGTEKYISCRNDLACGLFSVSVDNNQPYEFICLVDNRSFSKCIDKINAKFSTDSDRKNQFFVFIPGYSKLKVNSDHKVDEELVEINFKMFGDYEGPPVDPQKRLGPIYSPCGSLPLATSGDVFTACLLPEWIELLFPGSKQRKECSYDELVALAGSMPNIRNVTASSSVKILESLEAENDLDRCDFAKLFQREYSRQYPEIEEKFEKLKSPQSVSSDDTSDTSDSSEKSSEKQEVQEEVLGAQQLGNVENLEDLENNPNPQQPKNKGNGGCCRKCTIL